MAMSRLVGASCLTSIALIRTLYFTGTALRSTGKLDGSIQCLVS